MPKKKKIEVDDNLEEKLDYIGLDLEDLPKNLKKYSNINFRTIKGYDEEFGMYRLGFPNREVEEGFVKYLLPFYTSVSAPTTPFEIGLVVREIRSGDYDAFFRRLRRVFAVPQYELSAGQTPERDTELN